MHSLVVLRCFSEQIDIIKGKHGSAFIVDTFGLHRGRPLEKGRRLVLWARYGMGPNRGYLGYSDYFKSPHTLPLSTKEITAQLPTDPLSKYATRLIISDPTDKGITLAPISL